MKKHDVSHWILDSKIEGMLYFAQRINEMLFDYTLDTHKGRMYNSLILCIEALISIKQIEKGAIKDANIKYIIEELNWSLKQDTVIKYILADDFDVIIPLLVSNKPSDIKSILELISVRVTPAKYEAVCRDLLIKAILDNKKIAIDSYLESWLCIIKFMGYSEEYIYNTVNNYFFGTDHTINRVEYLYGFFDHINFEHKSYDVYVIVHDSLVHIISQSNLNDNITCDVVLPESISSKKKRSFNLKRKGHKHLKIIKVTTHKSLDIYSAYENVRYQITSILNLFAFFHHKSRPKIIDDFLVVNNENAYIISKPISPITKGFDANISIATNKMKKMLQGNAPVNATMASIDKVMTLHSLCIENTSIMNQLLNLWTAIEIIVPIDHSCGRDKIVQITDTIGIMLTLKYGSKIFSDLYKSMKLWDKHTLNHFISKVPVEYGNDLERFIAFVVLSEYEPDRKNLYNLLNDFPLLRYRIYSINKKFSTPKSIHDTMSNHMRKLSWHIRRIYRTRNSMVHNLSDALFVENIVTNVHSYIDEFVTTLLSLIQKDGKIMTIEQGMQYGALAYAYKMKYIKDVAALTAENYKSILLWN